MPHQALVPAFTTPLLSLPVFVTRRFWIRCHWSRVNKKLVKKYRNPKGAATGHKASDSLPVQLVHTLDLPGCNPSTSHLDGLGGKSLPGRWFWQYICLGGPIFWKKKTWRGPLLQEICWVKNCHLQNVVFKLKYSRLRAKSPSVSGIIIFFFWNIFCRANTMVPQWWFSVIFCLPANMIFPEKFPSVKYLFRVNVMFGQISFSDTVSK